MVENPAALVLLIASLFLDGLLSATANAFINSNPKRLLALDGSGRFGAALAARVAEDSTELILSMRLVRGLIRIVILIFVVLTFAGLFYREAQVNFASVAGILLAFGILIGLMEFLIESYVLRAPNDWAARTAYLARLAVILTTPIRVFVQRIGGIVVGLRAGKEQPLVTEEEIMTLVDAGEEGGVIEEDEKAMIYSIFQLGDTLAREVMIPRIDIQSLEESTSVSDSTDRLLKSGFSRAPVYRNSVDNITGVAYIKDLLDGWRKGKQLEPISRFMRQPYFIPEGMKLDDLMAEMQSKRIHMAIVVDEYGGTAGVVTIEDIVEEIVGEIRDEYDYDEEASYQQLRDGEFIFSGRIDLDDVNLLAGSELPKDTSETLGGFIYSYLGRVPNRGEVVEAGGLRLTVDQVVGRRIRKVRASLQRKSVSEKDSNAT